MESDREKGILCAGVSETQKQASLGMELNVLYLMVCVRNCVGVMLTPRQYICKYVVLSVSYRLGCNIYVVLVEEQKWH